MTARDWNTGEIQVLKLWAPLGATTIAALLNRSVSSVEHKARELRVSLKATRDDIDIQQTPIKILAKIREVPELQICPLCGKRLATMKATGMCRTCHLDQLIVLRETQLTEAIRERKLTSLRQNKHRLRICVICERPFFPRPTSKAIKCEMCGGTE